MTLPVAILAGGTATRLRPITQTIPKSLVDVAGKPFIARQLDYLRSQGIMSVVLCVGHLGDQIEATIGNGSTFGLNVRYSSDGPHLLGTGGALAKALPVLGPEFFVFYGDSYLPIDFRGVEQAYRASGKPALMTVLHNKGRWDRSNVSFRDRRIVEYEKRHPNAEMDYIDYGLGVLSAAAFEGRRRDEPFDLSEVYHDLSTRGLLAGHEVFQRFYEIGSHNGLHDTIEFFRQMEG